MPINMPIVDIWGPYYKGLENLGTSVSNIIANRAQRAKDKEEKAQKLLKEQKKIEEENPPISDELAAFLDQAVPQKRTVYSDPTRMPGTAPISASATYTKSYKGELASKGRRDELTYLADKATAATDKATAATDKAEVARKADNTLQSKLEASLSSDVQQGKIGLEDAVRRLHGKSVQEPSLEERISKRASELFPDSQDKQIKFIQDKLRPPKERPEKGIRDRAYEDALAGLLAESQGLKPSAQQRAAMRILKIEDEDVPEDPDIASIRAAANLSGVRPFNEGDPAGYTAMTFLKHRENQKNPGAIKVRSDISIVERSGLTKDRKDAAISELTDSFYLMEMAKLDKSNRRRK